MDKYWAEILFSIILLNGLFQIFRINKANDEAEMSVAALVGEEGWTSTQEITVKRQISTDTSLKRIEIGLGIIIGLMMIYFMKLFTFASQ